MVAVPGLLHAPSLAEGSHGESSSRGGTGGPVRHEGGLLVWEWVWVWAVSHMPGGLHLPAEVRGGKLREGQAQSGEAPGQPAALAPPHAWGS